MRRWMFCTSGILLALAVAFTVLLFSAPEAPPFPFLQGHMPVPVGDSKWYEAERKAEGNWRGVYTFEMDFDQLIAILDRELGTEGLARWPHALASDDERLYMPAAFVKAAHRDFIPSYGVPGVQIYRNSKALSESSWLKQRGWVTVVVDLPAKPSMLDNLRAWLGL